jgi:heme-degrading monooxygenase HmoA
MMLVTFEFEVSPSGEKEYFALAESLRAELEAIDGFISIERFESRSVAGHFLSLSVWRDEAAIRAWREASAHRAGQIRGRNGIFARYHIRVAQVVRDYDFAAETKAA